MKRHTGTPREDNRAQRRRFGQNFLVDEGTIRQIVEDIPCTPSDPLIEIGPGQGALTRRIIRRCGKMTAIEIDDKWVEHLRGKADLADLEVLQADASRVDWDTLLAGDVKPLVMGNLPYNRAAPILFKVLPHIRQTKGIYIMVQLEVAQRICSEPHNRAFGFLSVFVQNLAIPRLLRKISPEAFRPRPNVISATVELLPRETPFALEPEFLPFVERCFTQKRKKLVNSLLPFYPKPQVIEGLKSQGISEEVRAEDLSVEEFARLFRTLEGPQNQDTAKVTPGARI